MADDTPVLQTLADMTGASLEHGTLSPRDAILARIAALVSVGAPPSSYLLHAAAVAEVGLTADDVQGVLIAVAPIVGSPRVMTAGGNILRALGFAVGVLEAELEAEAEADDEG